MTTDGITILRARSNELAAIAAIENNCFIESDRFSRRILKYLINDSEGGCFTASVRGKIVGYISLLTRENARNVRIYSVAVDPSAQGFGVGRALIEYAIDYAVRSGYDRLTLEVRVDNAAAIELYRHLGFVELKRLPAYYHDGTDALKMVKTI